MQNITKRKQEIEIEREKQVYNAHEDFEVVINSPHLLPAFALFPSLWMWRGTAENFCPHEANYPGSWFAYTCDLFVLSVYCTVLVWTSLCSPLYNFKFWPMPLLWTSSCIYNHFCEDKICRICSWVFCFKKGRQTMIDHKNIATEE